MMIVITPLKTFSAEFMIVRTKWLKTPLPGPLVSSAITDAQYPAIYILIVDDSNKVARLPLTVCLATAMRETERDCTRDRAYFRGAPFDQRASTISHNIDSRFPRISRIDI